MASALSSLLTSPATHLLPPRHQNTFPQPLGGPAPFRGDNVSNNSRNRRRVIALFAGAAYTVYYHSAVWIDSPARLGGAGGVGWKPSPGSDGAFEIRVTGRLNMRGCIPRGSELVFFFCQREHHAPPTDFLSRCLFLCGLVFRGDRGPGGDRLIRSDQHHGIDSGRRLHQFN